MDAEKLLVRISHELDGISEHFASQVIQNICKLLEQHDYLKLTGGCYCQPEVETYLVFQKVGTVKEEGTGSIAFITYEKLKFTGKKVQAISFAQARKKARQEFANELSHISHEDLRLVLE